MRPSWRRLRRKAAILANGERLNIRGIGALAVGVPIFSLPLTVAID